MSDIISVVMLCCLVPRPRLMIIILFLSDRLIAKAGLKGMITGTGTHNACTGYSGSKTAGALFEAVATALATIPCIIIIMY